MWIDKTAISQSINLLMLGAFCQKHVFGTFWRFSAWIWVTLVPIILKRYLQQDSMPVFPLAFCFTAFLFEHAQKSKFGDFWTRM